MILPTSVHEVRLRSHLAAYAASIHPAGRLTDIETRINPDSKKPPAADTAKG